jgi:hypothetical protein
LMIGTRSESSRRRVAVILSQIAFAAGAGGGLARILMPSAVSTVSEELVNWPARSLIGNLTEVACWPGPVRRLRAACVVHALSGGAVVPARRTRRVPCSVTTGAWMRRGSTVSTGGEAGRDDAAGLRGQELLPGRAGAAWCGPGPGGMQDLPHRRCCDRMAGPGEFALHPPVPPRGIIGRDADHELADGGRRGRPPGTSFGRRRLPADVAKFDAVGASSGGREQAW